MYHKIILILLTIFAAVSCESEKELALVSQESQIDSYIQQTFAEYPLVRSNGTNRVVLQEGTTSVKAAKGDSLELIFEGYIFTLKGPSLKFVSDTAMVALDNSSLIKGLEYGLEGASHGEESVIIFSAKYGYQDKAVGLVPSMSPLLFNTFITKIKKN